MTDEQRNLLIQAKTDALYARKAYQDGMLRAACSRSYYAMFYVARAVVLIHNKSFSKHTALISEFGKVAQQDKRIPAATHRKLLDAYKMRGTADYDFAVPVTVDETARLVDYAQDFVLLGESLFGEISLEEQ